MSQAVGPSSEDPALTDVHVQRDVVSTTQRFRGQVWDIRTDVVDLGDGQQVERDFVQHTGAVGIVAVDDDLRVLLVRQYRHPVRAMLWEPPAGLLDMPGEDPLDAASRELFEEAGYRAEQWSVLIDAFTSPGGSNESVRIYLARDLTEVAVHERHVGHGEERDMLTRWVPVEVARAAVLAGDLHSPLAVMGLLAAASALIDGAPTVGVAFPRPVDAAWLRSGGTSRRDP
jgi:8-oxo-dGTP pyrophosphatase MutT (NUDIX family)